MLLSLCAKCTTHLCLKGYNDNGPQGCPMQFELPAAGDLYADQEIRNIARVAAAVEANGYCRWRRAEEIMEFAIRLGYIRLGVVACNDIANVARLYVDILEAAGFQTVVVTQDKDCDPIAAAETCSYHRTQLNILLGMHVGHDALFIRRSNTWVTSLVVRDRILVHNPVGALYGAKGYFRQALRSHQAGTVTTDKGDVSDRGLAAAAADVITAASDRWIRLEEVIEFAHRIGAVRLGLIFCAGLSSEAAVLNGILEASQFEVASVACKTGGVPKEAVGVLDSEKMQPGQPEVMCNPLAQVEILNRSNTQLNILMG